jgi:hypothetical protein
MATIIAILKTFSRSYKLESLYSKRPLKKDSVQTI